MHRLARLSPRTLTQPLPQRTQAPPSARAACLDAVPSFHSIPPHSHLQQWQLRTSRRSTSSDWSGGCHSLPYLTRCSLPLSYLRNSRSGHAHSSVICTGDFDEWKGTQPLSKDSATGKWTATVKVPYGQKDVKYKVCCISDLARLHGPSHLAGPVKRGIQPVESNTPSRIISIDGIHYNTDAVLSLHCLASFCFPPHTSISADPISFSVSLHVLPLNHIPHLQFPSCAWAFSMPPVPRRWHMATCDRPTVHQ